MFKRPNISDWANWVSPSSLRNYIIKDCILDWLGRYGESKGFIRDDYLPGFDPDINFNRFILAKGKKFEEAIIEVLNTKVDITHIEKSSSGDNITAFNNTLEAMFQGKPVIYQGFLRDIDNKLYGSPDLLIRSDVLGEIFPSICPDDTLNRGAPGLNSSKWHYRVIDIKYSTLFLNSNGFVSQSKGNSLYYILQVYFYMKILANLQQQEMPFGYLLGRKTSYKADSLIIRNNNAIDRLGLVKYDHVSSWGVSIEELLNNASSWVRKLRALGKEWDVLPMPTVPELRPNMTNKMDFPWSNAKKEIAKTTGELTLLWQVGVQSRERAIEKGITSFRSPLCTAENLGITNENRKNTFNLIMQINNEKEKLSVLPEKVIKYKPKKEIVEFFVDFENVTDIADDFSNLPFSGGVDMIFMIGCGYLENGIWKWRCFIADRLNEIAENTIIEEWFSYMNEIRKKHHFNSEPKIYHWSNAERGSFDTAFNSARNRHKDNKWPNLEWFDLLNEVVKKEPMVVKGNMVGFNLKDYAKALFDQGHINTLWEESSLDGLGAMTGAFACEELARKEGKKLKDIPLMKSIIKYNEVDCKVMMEILEFIRQRQ